MHYTTFHFSTKEFMNHNTWNTFYKDTKQLQKPAQAHQLLSQSDINHLQLLLIDVLNGFLNKGEHHIGMKIYIDSELRNDYILKLVKHPPKVGESLEEWSHQIFGDQKFGMILIGLEQYSNAFAIKAASMVSPLLKTAGMPVHGLSFLFFMGNYGFTPFGIHKEATGEDGILFHLGPENKQFYTWDDPKFNSLDHNTQVFHNVSEMISEGEEYILEPGDAMFIPHYVYHIGNTSEFSSSVVLDYINPPKDQFENDLIQATAEQGLKNHVDYEKPIEMEATPALWNQLIDIQSVQRKMELVLSRNILKLRSNGGLARKSIRNHATMPSDMNANFKGIPIFPLLYEVQTDDSVLIFARGHQMVIKNHPNLIELINRLNDGATISGSLVHSLLGPAWDLIDVFSFLQELFSKDAIEIDN